MKSSIQLNNMRFFAYHGVLPQERITGNNFVVNLRMDANLTAACLSDDVADTVNYAEVFTLVETEMAQPSNLLEHVAYRILEAVKSAFPQLTAIEVRLAKTPPPIAGEVESAEIVLVWEAE